MTRPTALRSLDGTELAKLADDFRQAVPCRHVVIDDMLVEPQRALDSFPARDWDGWESLSDNYQRLKFFSADVTFFPPELQSIFGELAAPAFLEQLERLTGIDHLIPDPYLDGGGLHLSLPSGVLVPHTDFHIYRRLGLYRRINVIIYLNEEWGTAGGALELYTDTTATEVAVSIAPELGRCVVFETDDRSVHGFARPVPEGRERRSIATYYYTVTDVDRFAGDGTTVWRRRETFSGTQRLRSFLVRTLISGSQRLSHLAYRIDPNRPRRHGS